MRAEYGSDGLGDASGMLGGSARSPVPCFKHRPALSHLRHHPGFVSGDVFSMQPVCAALLQEATTARISFLGQIFELCSRNSLSSIYFDTARVVHK